MGLGVGTSGFGVREGGNNQNSHNQQPLRHDRDHGHSQPLELIT